MKFFSGIIVFIIILSCNNKNSNPDKVAERYLKAIEKQDFQGAINELSDGDKISLQDALDSSLKYNKEIPKVKDTSNLKFTLLESDCNDSTCNQLWGVQNNSDISVSLKKEKGKWKVVLLDNKSDNNLILDDNISLPTNNINDSILMEETKRLKKMEAYYDSVIFELDKKQIKDKN